MKNDQVLIGPVVYIVAIKKKQQVMSVFCSKPFGALSGRDSSNYQISYVFLYVLEIS